MILYSYGVSSMREFLVGIVLALSIYEAPDSASNEQGQVSYNIVEEGNIMQK